MRPEISTHAVLDRILPRIKVLAVNPRPTGRHKLAGSKNNGRTGSATMIWHELETRQARENLPGGTAENVYQ